ncbi:hypothetical protein [Streptococcus mutans]|nr:hypothetical protein [Streptococcus mutans]QIQ94354.1 hypothetical protein HB753_07465 [Streptococcus mutans]QIR00592.1 hypothetical protein HB752_07455 [Streptococcus mutans]QIR02243.1 hypothetical protein HB751_06085 [Streptococcus mutans]QIR04373.1 hypothetical protein HB750_07465 [Streptococcus mutans]
MQKRGRKLPYCCLLLVACCLLLVANGIKSCFSLSIGSIHYSIIPRTTA